MGTILPSVEETEPEIIPLTPAQVAAVKAANPSTSPWWVVLAQGFIGGLAAVVALVFFGRTIALSLLCGVTAVVLPAALFARGLTNRFAQASVGGAVTSFFLWELVKVMTTVALLVAAHRWVTDLNWPAMLVGMVVTIKVYWLALAFRRKPRSVRV